MRKKTVKKGYTLIELSFAILFISVLLITLTLIASEIIAIYRKGYAIKTVNSVGRDLIDDFSAAVSQSPPSSMSGFCEAYTAEAKNNCLDDLGQKFIFQQYKTTFKLRDGVTTKEYPYGGVFCTGKYSYIWKTGFTMNSDYYTPNNVDFAGLSLSYGDGTTTTVSDFRLLKFEDTSRLLCSATLSDSGYTYNFTEANGTTINYPGALRDEPLELLETSDSPVAFFSFNVFPPAQTTATKKLYYSSSFILATISGGVDIMTNGNYCTENDHYRLVESSYCAINKFNFSMQANGG